MKNKISLLILALVLCLSMVFMVSCQVEVSADDLLDNVDVLLEDEVFVESIKGENGETPVVGDNGNWFVGGKDTGIKAVGEDGVTPTINENGNWFIGDVDTGVKAVGEDGVVPTINENGYWVIGDVDTGIKAEGVDGKGIKSFIIDEEGNLVITYTDGEVANLGCVEAPACEHSYSKRKTVIAATCTSIGYDTRTCSECYHVETYFTEALGHTFGEPITVKQGKNAILIYSCAVCGGAKVEATQLFSEGLEYGLIDDEAHYQVEGIGTCTDVDIIIPEEYNGKPVTEIAREAFFGSENIVSISVPDTIVKIGDKAFSKCENLSNVTMPDFVEIGLDVFRGSINVEINVKHTLDYVEAKAPTCDEAGNIAYYYCETCDEFYADADGEERIYEVVVAPSHEFVEGVCNNCYRFQEDVTICYVDPIAPLGKFALGTLENAIGLPEQVRVITLDDTTHVLSIVWDMSTYVKNAVGEYTITGYIQLEGFYMEEGLTNKVETTVEIVDYMEGTADIVFILDISGSMGSYINNVKNNIIAFAQAIEDIGVSARWSAITYSDFTCSSAANEQTQVVMNGVSEWFTQADGYKTAISNIVLAGGGDAPETAVDGLLMANYELSARKDSRVFYILLTDDSYKNVNNYGVDGMSETIEILNNNSVNVSVITTSSYSSYYYDLYTTTGGSFFNINGNFSNDLLETLVPIIYEEVVD